MQIENKNLKKILIILLSIFIVMLCAFAFLICNTVSKKGKSNSGTGEVQSKTEYENNNGYYISDKLYCSAPDANSVIEEDGISFVSNEIIVHTLTDTKREDVLELINEYGGQIVGEIAVTGTYQVRFEDKYSYSELEDIIATFEKNPCVSKCSVNMIIESESAFYPEKDNEYRGIINGWNTKYPAGNNWGLEAIDAPKAWDYRDYMEPVNVGIIDCCFKDHKDLKYAGRINNNPELCDDDHGTHVAGTIAAGFNDGGITGVSPTAKVYGLSEDSSETTMDLEVELTTLIVENNCKVINISREKNLKWASFTDNGVNISTTTVKQMHEQAEALSLFLNEIISKGHDDFVICVAAGNENNQHEFHKYQNKKDPSLVEYCRKGDDDSLFSEEEKKEYIMSKIVVNSQAEYSHFLNVIKDPEVKNRIIVVGACQDNLFGEYSYWEFSGIGERVDIMAPGRGIYSCAKNDTYMMKSGTSMATPHVSGVAAMIFALNPDLSGDEVKQIILDTATTVPGCDYKMLNAGAAVEKSYNEFVMNPEDKLHNTFMQIEADGDKKHLYFFPGDYDQDGKLEAFGIIGEGDEALHPDVDIWFIDSKRNCYLAKADTHGAPEGEIVVPNGKFLSWCVSASGSGSQIILLGVKDGMLFEPEISEKNDSFAGKDSKYAFPADMYENLDCDYIAQRGYFLEEGGHMFETIAYDYDETTREFIEKSFESSSKLTEDEAMDAITEWLGGDLGTWVDEKENVLTCDGLYECDGKEYYQFRLKGWVDNHTTTLTTYVISADGTEIFEGMCSEGFLYNYLDDSGEDLE